MIRKILFAVLLFTLTMADGSAKKLDFNYEIVPQGVGVQGTALVKVYVFAKSAKKGIEQARMCAVHGVLFKGVPNGGGVAAQPAMVKTEEKNANQAFFDAFFQNKDYLQYTSLVGNGAVSSGMDAIKIGSKYKIGFVVSVKRDDLRQMLEGKGIIKKLGYTFQ